MIYLTKERKKQLVIKLLNEGKTYREIQQILHVTPNFIATVVKEEFGKENVINNPATTLSKNARAIQLLGQGKDHLMIAIELDMDADQINKSYSDFIRLKNLARFDYLLRNHNTEKLSLIVELANILQAKGITQADSIKKIFNDIGYSENLKKEIYHLSEHLKELNFKEINLKNQISEKNKVLKIKNDWLRCLKTKKEDLILEISKNQEIINQQKRLFNTFNDSSAFQDLKNLLKDNIENVILDNDNKILRIFLAVCEAYKDDPQMRKLFHEYYNEFKDKKLSVASIDERVQYLEDSALFNYVPEKITNLVDVYSVSVIKFVLERYFVSNKLFLDNNTVLD